MVRGQKFGLSFVKKPGGQRSRKTVRTTTAVVDDQRFRIVQLGACDQAQGQNAHQYVVCIPWGQRWVWPFACAGLLCRERFPEPGSLAVSACVPRVALVTPRKTNPTTTTPKSSATSRADAGGQGGTALAVSARRTALQTRWGTRTQPPWVLRCCSSRRANVNGPGPGPKYRTRDTALGKRRDLGCRYYDNCPKSTHPNFIH